MKKTILAIVCLFLAFQLSAVGKNKSEINQKPTSGGTVWSIEKANSWYGQQPWLSGCNYQPCTAINQIEMWQAETFDPATIDKEMGWAEELGFNTMRVFLSSVVWKHDADGFKQRINQFLKICNKHKIRPLFVFFDDCWNAESAIGKQPDPKPGVHNSGWVRDPSTSLRAETTKLNPILEKYVKDILGTFKNDNRIMMWDLYNEPGNSANGILSLPLLKNAFKWAREINPSQPLTVGVWKINSLEMNALNAFQISNSDIVTYHNYGNETDHETWVNLLKIHERPLICTEYMARKNDSYFQKVMPMLKHQNVGAINWGFVSGKTNTIFAWSEPLPDQKEPSIWFHDIYRQDHTPFDTAEISLIKRMNGKIKDVKLMKSEAFSELVDGKQVSLFTLKNKAGIEVQITNFGGRIVSLWTPDRNSKYDDIVTGFKSLEEYRQTKEVYFGALIGRYANRIGKGQFNLDGVNYQLATNNGQNHLHGGIKGFFNVVWDAKQYKNSKQEDVLELHYLSPDGDESYPGNLLVTVNYTLTFDNELKIEYRATTDRKTIVNLTNHTFFNLHGFTSGKAKSINSHVLKINSTSYTPTDNGLIPTGVIFPVIGTPMDFRVPTAIGERVNESFPDLINGKGYDHNWIIDKPANEINEMATVYEPSNGRQIFMYSTEPALQFYGGNVLDGTVHGKYGEIYSYRTSFALEAQHYPDSPNHPNFPSTVLNPGETYRQTTIYKFGVK